MTGCYIAVTKAVEWCGEKKILTYDKLDSNSITISYTVIVVQSLSCVELFATPWTAAHKASPSFTISWSLLKLKLLSIESVIPSRHLILSPPSPPALKLSQHQGLFHWVSSSHQVAKVLELQLQHQSLQWIFRVDFLQESLVWSPCSPRNSQESSPAP